MASFHLGAVSNCWAAQLPHTGLEAQCGAALARGYRYVELRQRALAECEEQVAGDERPWPLPEQLRRLGKLFPDLGFNLAVELPFMTEPVDADTPYLERLCEAALALAEAGGRPLLRFVDVSPAPALLTAEQVERLAGSTAGLTAALASRGIATVLENSKQPVGTLLELMRQAAAGLEGITGPFLCWDAANQVQQTFVPEDAVETARTVPVASVFEFHFKQLRDGALQPGVGDGDLDWSAILAAFRAGDFVGPALFEIPPGEDIWERLDAGTGYIRGLIASVEGQR